MDLLRTTHSKNRYEPTISGYITFYRTIRNFAFNFSLVVSPSRFSNISRFISGVNNSLPYKQQHNAINVRCSRYNIRGKATVLMWSSKKITNGSKLCYDYNGLDDGYPTENFV